VGDLKEVAAWVGAATLFGLGTEDLNYKP